MLDSFRTSIRTAAAALVLIAGVLTYHPGQAIAQEPVPAVEATAAPAETATTEAAPEAAPVPPTTDEVMTKLTVGIDTIWVMVCGTLVFFMNLGFGCVESGFCRATNCDNLRSKQFVVFPVCSIVLWLVGGYLMFG